MAKSGPLRYRSHLHPTEGNADDRAQNQADCDPFIVDDAVMQQGAGDGEQHA